MSDIKERLRSNVDAYTRATVPLFAEAADEIERLERDGPIMLDRCETTDGTPVPITMREALAQADMAADAEAKRSDELFAENERLERELAQCREDAERYRWLRAALADRTANGKSHWFCGIREGCPKELDAAIDAARASEPPSARP